MCLCSIMHVAGKIRKEKRVLINLFVYELAGRSDDSCSDLVYSDIVCCFYNLHFFTGLQQTLQGQFIDEEAHTHAWPTSSCLCRVWQSVYREFETKTSSARPYWGKTISGNK